MKPFAESCEQNKHPILAVLREEFAQASEILEIGSGTGQHAVFFARALPHLHWQTSDCSENHPGILAWLSEDGGDNVHLPLTLDVSRDPWPRHPYDGIFSANTVHIMASRGSDRYSPRMGASVSTGHSTGTENLMAWHGNRACNAWPTMKCQPTIASWCGSDKGGLT